MNWKFGQDFKNEKEFAHFHYADFHLPTMKNDFVFQ